MDGNTDYLPEIEEAPDSNVNMVINEEVECVRPVDDNEVDDDNVEVEEEEEENIPEVKPKKILEQREIFKPPKLQQVISTTTGKPKKKMSQKQLDHLAKIRKKAMETRMKNKKLREEGKAVETSKKVQKENVRKKNYQIKKLNRSHLTQLKNMKPFGKLERQKKEKH